MTIALVGVLGVAFGGVARPLAAQTLQLEPVKPLPALRGESVTLSVSAVLLEEITKLGERRVADGVAAEAGEGSNANGSGGETLDAIVRRARIEFRRLAYELLVRSAEGSGPADALALHGFRLADARRRIDVRLERLLEGSVPRADGSLRTLGVREKDRVGRLLRRFTEVAPSAFGSADLGSLTQADAAIAVAIRPLVDALALLEEFPTGDGLGTGWPTPDDVGGSTLVEQSRQTSDPCADATLASLGPATRRLVAAVCLAGTPPEGSAADRIDAAVELSRAATLATWLDAIQRAALDQRAAAALEGNDSLALLRAQAELIDFRTRLEAVAGRERDGIATLDAAIIASLFPDAEGSDAAKGSLPVALAESPAELARVILRIAESVDIAVRARASERRTPPKEFRTMLRDAERRYARIEQATWTKLPAMLADEDAITNPAQIGLVRDQREAFGDLDRIAGVQRMIDAIGGVRPQAMRGVSARLRTVARWLGEPTRRADALTVFETMELHLTLFLPLPYEREVREGGDEALAFTAGRGAELVQQIELARSRWADAWAQGNGTGPAAERMFGLYRLLRAMEELSQGQGAESRDAVAALSRWGAFHATKAALAPALVDVQALVQLATTAALAGDGERLARELDRIDRDAPLARLVGRLHRELAAWLATRPGDALGQLVAMRDAPPSNAWGLSLRMRLAAILRAARELDAARRDGRREDEEALLAHLGGLARATLDVLGAERSALPTLPPLPGGEGE
jgi:hypothetical protein